MRITLDKNKLKVALFLLAIYFLLTFGYFKFISSFWYWNKIAILKDEVFSFYPSKYIFATLIFIFDVFLVCGLKQKQFIFSIQAMILLFFVMPAALTFASFDLFDNRIFLSHNIFLWALILVSKIKININKGRITPKKAYYFVSIATLIGIVPFFQYLPKMNISNLLLMNIYETRAVFTDVGNIYTDYTFSWFTSILIPTLIVFSIHFKKRTALFILIVLLLYMFLYGAQKSVFFGVFVVLVFYYGTYLLKIKNILKWACGILVLGILSSWLISNDIILIYSFRRVLMLPSLLDYTYFDFFSDKYLYWSETIGNVFMEYPFKEKHSKIIGDIYFDSPFMSANNGIISDGFMNYGMIGVFINITIVAIFFSVMNQLNISHKFFGLFFLFIISILSSSLSTVLLTHGGLLLFLVAIIFFKDTDRTMGVQVIKNS